MPSESESGPRHANVVSTSAWICCRKETKVQDAGHFVVYIECVELFEFFERWIEYKSSNIFCLLPMRIQVSAVT